MPTLSQVPIPAFEQLLRDHLRSHGDDLDAQGVNFNLFRTSNDVLTTMESTALRPLGLTHAGFVILMAIWVAGPLEMRDIARLQRVSTPAAVSAVDTLVRADLVRRVRSTADRRLVSVELTATGRRGVAAAHEAWHREERRTAAVLTRTEQRTLAALLRKLRTGAHRNDSEPAI